ncbi:TlpA disulfide reductase family protein [Sphingobacterium sp. SGL-16]|uniref:TlpA disulfide reductase family protein n=1 Tax=Sphingobacterium sp. SGL-16 TaxID=2710883 RepID=UPI0013EB6BAE|nr:TlpA disulfide reductase family protein [Sphingobacterium sp. SGL-16]NGM74140.1 AhpC/TSA family protein [Sphingobacterium sp. SGL-16]
MKFIYIILASILFNVSVFGQNGFVIQGKAAKQFEGSKLYLDYQRDGYSFSDSTVIKQGKFTFKGEVDEPNYARMILDSQGLGKLRTQNTGDRLYFYIGNENYNFNITESLKKVAITKSPLHESFVQYINFIGGDFMDIIDQGNAAFSAVPEDAVDKNEQYAAIKQKFDEKFDKRNDQQLLFAKQNPNSIFAVDALTEVANKRGTKIIETIFLDLNKSLQNSSRGKELAARIYADKNIVIGSMAPNFAQPDQQGKMVQLSDFKGKFVLLDFWASWCSPCRAENPNLKKAYINFKPKGLEVFAISIDDNNGREAWLQAIKDDDLPWIHAADLKGWRNDAAVLYGVRGVPQNYLIDPTGKIVAINLKQENLHKVLAEYIK